MLRSINIRVGADLADGTVLPSDTKIVFTRLDTYVRESGGVVWSVTPDRVNARLVSGVATVRLSDGVWQVREWWSSGRTFFVQVTSDSLYEDLVGVDPSTLEPLDPIPPSAQDVLVQAGLARDTAVVSAGAASVSAGAAEVARVAAEDAQGLSVGARDTAVAARDTASAAALTATGASDIAVAAKDTAVTAKDTAVTSAGTATTQAGNAGTSAGLSEAARVAAVAARSGAETAQAAAAEAATVALASSSRVWVQGSAPTAGRWFKWDGAVDASPSEYRQGSDLIAKNLFPNPNLVGDGTMVEVRRNLVQNPRALASGTSWGLVSSTLATGSSEISGGVSFYRATCTLAGSAVGVVSSLANTGAVSVGEVFLLTCKVRTNADLPAGWTIDYRQAGVATSWTYNSTPALAANNWATVTFAVKAVNATTGDGSIRISGSRTAGQTVDVTDASIERVDSLSALSWGSFFDPDPDLTPSWTGTPNASASILSGERTRGVSGGYVTKQWSAHNTALRIPAGNTATLAVSDTKMLVKARAAGQLINGVSGAAGDNTVNVSGTVTLGAGDWAQVGVFPGGYAGDWFAGDTRDDREADLWVDTGNGNRAMRWADGWVDAADRTLESRIAALEALHSP
jgi:hypothetical protein